MHFSWTAICVKNTRSDWLSCFDMNGMLKACCIWRIQQQKSMSFINWRTHGISVCHSSSKIWKQYIIVPLMKQLSFQKRKTVDGKKSSPTDIYQVKPHPNFNVEQTLCSFLCVQGLIFCHRNTARVWFHRPSTEGWLNAFKRNTTCFEKKSGSTASPQEFEQCREGRLQCVSKRFFF